jgi:hypothetical protein
VEPSLVSVRAKSPMRNSTPVSPGNASWPDIAN